MKVKNETLFKLEQVLIRFDQVAARSKATGLVKLKYALARNKNRIKEPIESIREATSPDEAYREYEKALGKLAEEYSEIISVDEKTGKEKKKPPQRLPDGRISYSIDDNRQEEYEKKVEELKESEEHKEAVTMQKSREKEFQKLLKETSDVEFFKFNFSLIPEEVELFTVDDLEVFFDLQILNEDVDVNAAAPPPPTPLPVPHKEEKSASK